MNQPLIHPHEHQSGELSPRARETMLRLIGEAGAQKFSRFGLAPMGEN
jgi:hypothetical protein